jgi:DNA invertase Pin-like site-specific DNA recombinase
MKRIGVGLIRVSTGAQADADRASIPAQREIISQIASRNDVEIRQVFELVDVSGAEVAHSREYNRFLQSVKDPSITCVITREFSRLMRPERFDDMWILQAFVDSGITLYFPNDVMDLSNRQARFMAHIRASVAGLERGDIAERVASAKEVMRRRGDHPCGEHTLARGLGHTKEKGWYYDEAELQSVRLLFKLFLGGCHVYEQLSELTGISRTSIPIILRNPVYAGSMVYSQKKDMSAAGYIQPTLKRKGYRRKVARAPEEVIRVKLPLEPIITEEQHQQILAIVDQKRRHWASARADAIPRFTYRGVLYCGVCSSPMYTWAAQHGKDFYHCKMNLPRYRNREGAVPCSNKHMSRHLLEPVLDRELVGHLSDKKFLTSILESYIAQRRLTHLASADDLLQQRYDALVAKRERIKQAFVDGMMSRLETNQRLSDLGAEFDSLCKVKDIDQRSEMTRSQVIAIVKVFRRWPHLDMDAKREILVRTVPEIFVHRYLVKGVSLRVGYNTDNHPKSGVSR